MVDATDPFSDPDGAYVPKTDQDILTQLDRQVDPICMDTTLDELVSGGRKAVILHAATIISQNQPWIAYFVIRNFREFLHEDPEVLVKFIVHNISLFPSVLIDFVLDKVVKAQRFKDLSYIREGNPNDRIRHAARDLLDANVHEIADPSILIIIGAFGLDKAARRTAIEKLAQGGHKSSLSFIAHTSSNPDPRFASSYDEDIAALANKAKG